MKANNVIRAFLCLGLLFGTSIFVRSLYAHTYAYNLYGVEVIGNSYWVCGANGQILHSVDGKSWVLQKTGVDATLTAIAFLNSQRGFCVGYNGTVLKTEDGGKRWVKVPIDTKYFLTGICFVNDKKGFITGEFGGLFVSNDGGEHWKPILREKLDIIFQAIDFFDGKDGWAVGEFGAAYHSSDGGNTWKKVDVGAEEYTLFGVKIIDRNRVMITSMDGLIFVTENGGKTWQRKTLGDIKNQFLGVECINRNDVYVFGRGAILKTNLDLTRFQSIDLGKELAYGWVYRFRKNTGIGNDGYIYKLSNGKFSKERVSYNNRGDK